MEKVVKFSVVVGEMHIKEEKPGVINSKRDEDMLELCLRQEIPQEIIDWFKTL